MVALAVFSHWVFDLVVHRPDLPLYDNTATVGFGLWNLPGVAFALEAALLFAGMWLYLSTASVRRVPVAALGLVMLAIQAFAVFGPPPTSDKAAAWTALAAYTVIAGIIARLARARHPGPQGAAS